MTTKTIDPRTLDEEERGAFVEGWTDAGGYIDDGDTPEPWCAPWDYETEIPVSGETAYDWGASYWETIQEDVIEAVERCRRINEETKDEAEE